MKKALALFLALMLLAALCACSKEEIPNFEGGFSDTAIDKGPGSSTDTGSGQDGSTKDEPATAIGVANPYEEIDEASAAVLFTHGLTVPADSEDVHYFEVNTGGGTRMLQVQFKQGGVQYILRCKAAARLTNISAAYASWDSEKDVEINGCEGRLSLASGGAASLLWFDEAGGLTYALSANEGTGESIITTLAESLFTPADGSGSSAPDGGTDGTPSDEDEVPPPPEKEAVKVQVYYTAADGVNFTSVELTTKELSEDYLIGKLIGLGVLSSNVSAQWLEGMAIDEQGNIELALSLSPEFGTLLMSCDAQKEHMLMGCIVNTFLASYDASRIWIYVDGNDPVSATRTYNEPLTKYGPYDPNAAPEEDAEEEDEPEEDIPEAPAPNLTLAEKICQLAKSKVGAEYVYGGAGPDTFDNSGFVYYCFKENGIDIARRTTQMYEGGTPVAQDDLQPGDVVFFTYEDDRSPSYVGIYLGDGQFIAENREGVPVTIMDMTTKYFQDIYIGARRYT